MENKNYKLSENYKELQKLLKQKNEYYSVLLMDSILMALENTVESEEE